MRSPVVGEAALVFTLGATLAICPKGTNQWILHSVRNILVGPSAVAFLVLSATITSSGEPGTYYVS